MTIPREATAFVSPLSWGEIISDKKVKTKPGNRSCVVCGKKLSMYNKTNACLCHTEHHAAEVIPVSQRAGYKRRRKYKKRVRPQVHS